MVVLYEVSREPLGLEPLEVEPLDKEPALVPVDVELDEQQAVEREACNFHVRRHSGGDIDVSPDSVDHSASLIAAVRVPSRAPTRPSRKELTGDAAV